MERVVTEKGTKVQGIFATPLRLSKWLRWQSAATGSKQLRERGQRGVHMEAAHESTAPHSSREYAMQKLGAQLTGEWDACGERLR